MVESVLRVDDLKVTFQTENGISPAIRGVSFQLHPEEVLGIVGESGSGKSVTSLSIMGLLAKNATIEGSIFVDGRELSVLSEKEISKLRGTSMSMIFQDPMTSLNPVYSIGWQISEAIRAHKDISKEEALGEAVKLLELVGIPRASERLNDYPHEFSGGMRQRVVIAIAIANQPKIILADEPTTALDVTVQAQVLQTLRDALEVSKAALVLITHDLGVIAGLANRIIVMYAGRIVELGDVNDIFYSPAMPYTHGLLGSVPSMEESTKERLRQIPGSPPTNVMNSVGCPFAPRCPLAADVCREMEPELREVVSRAGGSDRTHLAACHFSEEVQEMKVASMFPESSEELTGGVQ